MASGAIKKDIPNWRYVDSITATGSIPVDFTGVTEIMFVMLNQYNASIASQTFPIPFPANAYMLVVEDGGIKLQVDGHITSNSITCGNIIASGWTLQEVKIFVR